MASEPVTARIATGAAVGAFIAHHSHCADVWQHSEGLPDVVGEACRPQFHAYYGIGLTQGVGLVGGDLPDDAHCQARAGERADV